jgi:hypothetical protein
MVDAASEPNGLKPWGECNAEARAKRFWCFLTKSFYNAPGGRAARRSGESMPGFTFRKYQRFKESVPVQYHAHGNSGEGLLIDLSLNGGHIKGTMPIPEGMVLELKIAIAGDGEPLLIEQAVVQWVKGLEFGVEFTPQRVVAERITALIAELVKKRQGFSD